jgi:hypothetical protein
MKGATLALLGLLTLSPVYAADTAPGGAAEKAPAPAAAPADATAPAAKDSAAAPASTGSVARAVFTSKVVDREPTDNITTLTSDAGNISFFTELQGLQGQTVTHRWEHGDKVMAEIKFEVGAPRWRVFSSKRLDPSWTGEWKVSVVDANGSTLSAATFTYAAGDKPAKETAPAAAPASAPASDMK